jgi:hypothetical protein
VEKPLTDREALLTAGLAKQLVITMDRVANP